MKKIKLEVVVADEIAGEVLMALQKFVIKDLVFYMLTMEECYGQD